MPLGLILVLLSVQTAPAQPLLWGDLRPGGYGVGFRTVEARGGPHLAVWYPAAGGGERLRFSDYLRESPDLRGAIAGFERDRGKLRETLATAMTGRADGVAVALLDRVLDAPVSASRGAVPAGGRFPLLLWTPRSAVPAAQSVLCEYLASHGFVVAAPRPAGAASRLPFEAATTAAKRETLEAQIAEMASALFSLAREDDVDAARTGVLAWSYAGEAATIFQTRERRVRLVVGLSTNHLDNPVYGEPDSLAGPDPAALDVPYVALTERTGTDGRARRRPALLDRIAGGGFFVQFPRLAHGNFNALEGFVPALVGLDTVQPWSKGGPDARLGYELIVDAVRRVAAAYLEPEPSGRDPFAGWPPLDVPAGFVVIEAASGHHRLRM